MNFVFISPHFPATCKNICKALKNRGINVLGIADTPYAMLEPDLKAVLTDYYEVSDLHNTDELARACGFFTYKYGKIDRVESNNEYWLMTDAAIREMFNVFGKKPDELRYCIQKSLMKAKFIEAGITVARGRVLDNYQDAKNFVAEVGFPIVGKPDRGVGASGTYKLESDAELQAFFADKADDTEYIFEEFISGQIVTYDGIVDRNGEPVLAMSSVYGEGVMESVNSDNHIYFFTDRHIDPVIEEYGRRILKTFDLKERFFHFEFFRTHNDGKILALEVNCRAPGGFTMDMWNYACDTDVYGIYADLVAYGKTDISCERKYYSCHIGRKSNRNYQHSHGQIMNRFGHMVTNHMELPAVLARAMGNYVYLIRATEKNELMDAVNYILWLD
ncbi:MAG: ATP-grasp domain-containing protein [Negativicutes bacterium]|jgi:carbamoylphosphate synthase large subunit